MGDTRHGGTLARTHEGEPGLPRGRSRLPPPAVRASQRERLLPAVTAAVSELGYPAVTVGDVVKRARVSRAAFYAHFADKESCFLAAMREGGNLMARRVVSATRALPAGVSDEEVLRAACRAFLAFLTEEPAFARVFYIDLPGVGPRATEPLVAAGDLFEHMIRAWHERARVHHPEWPVVPGKVYLALAAAGGELVRSMVRTGETDALGDLEGTLVSLHLAILAGRRWPSECSGVLRSESPDASQHVV